MPVGNNRAPVKASKVNYTQKDAWISAGESQTGAESYQPARNWLDGIYADTITSIQYPTFQGTTYTMNYISNQDAFSLAKVLTQEGNIYGLTKSADSHLVKNSEWGAIAYLSQSTYGLNGTDIAINNINLNSGGEKRTNTQGKSGVDSVYSVTGCTTGEASSKQKITTIANINSTTGNTAEDGVYTWNQLTGTKASSTGTIYGVYDMSGGFEKVSMYIANGNNVLKQYGEAMTYENNSLKQVSTKYTTCYPLDSTADNTQVIENQANGEKASVQNWLTNTKIYGDALREVSKSGDADTNWYGDYVRYMCLNNPFAVRSGAVTSEKLAGLFYMYPHNGTSHYFHGFRAVLVVG